MEVLASGQKDSGMGQKPVDVLTYIIFLVLCHAVDWLAAFTTPVSPCVLEAVLFCCSELSSFSPLAFSGDPVGP